MKMTTQEKQGNGWDEWGRFVLKELERLNGNSEQLQQEIAAMRVEVAGLKVKASTWGGLAGLITVLAMLLLQSLTSP